jgi:murein L,D-transpeptidase YafK
MMLNGRLAALDAKVGNPVYIRVLKRSQAEFDQNSSIADTDSPHSYHPGVNYRGGGQDFSQKDSKGQMNRYSTFVGSAEVYIMNSNGKYVLMRSFPVSTYSGVLGPKVREGDDQTPEGFYDFSEGSHDRDSKPNIRNTSQYRAALWIDYPNGYDREHGHTGGDIEMHGCYKSGGCLAMGSHIDDIYTLVDAALKNGQKKVPLHIFPFPLTDANLAKIPDSSPLKRFWKGLQPGYDSFQSGLPENYKQGSVAQNLPPSVDVEHGKYQFSEYFPGSPNDCVNQVSGSGERCHQGQGDIGAPAP